MNSYIESHILWKYNYFFWSEAPLLMSSLCVSLSGDGAFEASSS